ncbi:ABC transporter permease [Skermanella stibiiresistens SB22]|uniref:ABC transporter permease n=1 Tax=Skermanella stibiiresistens SB22 TaxID=1385369 RepID=W9GYY1_9PROT|nr:ABC transporter permease [Skermanella stibiiresistens]EWY37821.1 ABC transporter permease [Skermanella stibiiresistens SB22]
MRQPLPQRLLGISGKLLIAAILGFIILPAVVVTIAAFNSKAILTFPPSAYSFRWFERAVSYGDFKKGFQAGLTVTLWASTIALVVGAAFAFAINRYQFKFKRALEGLLLSPLIVPHFTIGLGLLMLAAQTGLPRGYPLIVFCHVVLVLPFVMRCAYISLQNLDTRLELAAASLGASPLKILLTVTLPLLVPGLVSGWLFAAILSFNEFTASLFVTTQATQTLPVAMYNYVREYADPTLAALSVIYIVVTAVLLSLANAYLGLGKVLNVEQGR